MKRVKLSLAAFWWCLATSIGLFVAGFYVPPRGVIDGSVLSAGGILLGFATLAQLPEIVNGRRVTMTHGQTSVTLSGEGKKKGCDPLPQRDDEIREMMEQP